MADDQGTSTGRNRLIALGALAILVIAASLAFGRVFASGVASWKLVGAGLLALAVAGALANRNLWFATVASAALLIVTVGVLVFDRTTLYGLPTLDTLKATAEALGRVGTEARIQVAPTPPLAPLLLAALTAVWTATFSAHALAVRAGSPLLACLPAAALLAFSDAVLESRPRAGFSVLFLLGVLAVLFADALRRVSRWGPVWSRPGSRRGFATRTTGGRRVAAVAVVAAVLFPGALPGYGSAALIDFSTGGGDDPIGIEPTVSIKAYLTDKDPVELFRVRSERPAYWRLFSLDRFDGEAWTAADLQAKDGVPVAFGVPLNRSLGAGPVFEQTFSITHDLNFGWVPAAYPLHSLESPDSSIRFDEELDTAVSSQPLGRGTTYSAISGAVVPTTEELEAVQFREKHLGPSEGQTGWLPANLPPEIGSIAEVWTGGETSDYGKMLAIQEHLLKDFEYSLDVKPSDSANALLEFLTVKKRGFCQQFAGAMAVLLRALGYPARVAVGFTQGVIDPASGEYVVETRNLHSWVEVYFPGYGWIAFEPTPGRTNPTAQTYLDPQAAPCIANPREFCTGQEQGAGAKDRGTKGLPPRIRNVERRLIRNSSTPLHLPGLQPKVESPAGPLRTLLPIAGLLAALALVLIPPSKAARRRLRTARARDPRARVAATFAVFEDRASDLGLPRRSGETPEEYARRLVDAGCQPAQVVGRAVTGAVYGPRTPSEITVERTDEAAREAIRVLRRGTPLSRRAAGAYRLRRTA